jgi:beta-glucosidase
MVLCKLLLAITASGLAFCCYAGGGRTSTVDSRVLVDKKTEAAISTLVARMTLAEKAGQMTQAERESVTIEDVAVYCLGSVLSGGGSAPNDRSVAGWANMYDAFQKSALKTRLKIPLIYGIDAVHGHNNVPGATIFPHNIGMGATRNPDLYRKTCRITASEVRATGLNWTFSPCITVPQDERWGRTYEGFGQTPQIQTMFARAAVNGYQASGEGPYLFLAACAKHFVGDGGTAYGSSSVGRKLLDQGDTRISEAELRAVHMPGFYEAVNAGVATIMASFSSFNGMKIHANRYLLTDVLKKEMGFQGFVVSDWEAIGQIDSADYRKSIKTAVNAGIDMAMEPYQWKKFVLLLIDCVQKGEIPMSRIDDAVTRILRVKYAIGLMDADAPLADRARLDSLGCESHRRVARDAVRQSMVLLKNEKKTLPLARKGRTIVVTGSHANKTGLLCGGWTISWQGDADSVISGATTVYEGIRRVADRDSVFLVPDTTIRKGADAAIVVVGEQPYAEMEGDRTGGELVLDRRSRELISGYHAIGVPVVTVLVSGRPLVVTKELAASDAFVMAWLPGSEGEGVADVLFGDYRPTGKLPLAWPADTAQIPVNQGPGKKPLFELGFGLSY